MTEERVRSLGPEHRKHRWLRENWYRDVWLLFVTGLVILALHKQSSYINRTHNSLCTLVADLHDRVDGTKKFLSEHPDGIPGVPKQTLLDSLANQERTLVSLKGLKCDK
jgi:hypothetical protein